MYSRRRPLLSLYYNNTNGLQQLLLHLHLYILVWSKDMVKVCAVIAEHL